MAHRGTSPTDFAHLFPSYEATSERVRALAPHFFRCPEGHNLPHRMPWGRCTPASCVDAEGTRPPDGPAEGTDEYAVEKALTPLGCSASPALSEDADLARTARLKAQNRAALELMETIGENAALDALMALPMAPPVPDFRNGDRTMVTGYLEALAPAAAVLLGRRLFYGKGKDRHEAAQEILDRAGFPRRKEALPQMRAPIVINLGGATLPYEKQGRSSDDETYLAVVSRSTRGLPPRDEAHRGGEVGGDASAADAQRASAGLARASLPWGEHQGEERPLDAEHGGGEARGDGHGGGGDAGGEHRRG